MPEIPGPRTQVSEQDRRFIVDALKLLTGFQRMIPEVKQTLETLLKK